MLRASVGLVLLALLITNNEAASREPRQVSTVTRTSTTTTTSFTTVTSTTRTVCANFVNATSACRRKRQFWIDTPLVLAMDEDIDPLAQELLHPTPILSVEHTRLPIYRQDLFNPEQVALPIQPSINLKASIPDFRNPYLFPGALESYRPSGPYVPVHRYSYGSPHNDRPESRLGAVGLLNLFAQILRVAPTTTITVTTTVRSTTTSVTTTTGTLVISGCSPPGITYSTCRSASG